MFELHKKLGSAKLNNEKEIIQRWIDATYSEIDGLVYDLYGLTDEEIKIVEKSWGEQLHKSFLSNSHGNIYMSKYDLLLDMKNSDCV